MSLCTDVNLDLLNRCFDLGPLHGLRKMHPDDITAPSKSPEPGKYYYLECGEEDPRS